MSAVRQEGATTVEFAIVGLMLMVITFAALEFGRIVFTYNVLQEGARRGARVAAICPVNDGAIVDATLLLPLPALGAGNVETTYLGEDGAVLADPAGANYAQIKYVRVAVVDYDFDIFIPLVPARHTAREFTSTLPRESLGVPFSGAAPASCG